MIRGCYHLPLRLSLKDALGSCRSRNSSDQWEPRYLCSDHVTGKAVELSNRPGNTTHSPLTASQASTLNPQGPSGMSMPKLRDAALWSPQLRIQGSPRFHRARWGGPSSLYRVRSQAILKSRRRLCEELPRVGKSQWQEIPTIQWVESSPDEVWVQVDTRSGIRSAGRRIWVGPWGVSRRCFSSNKWWGERIRTIESFLGLVNCNIICHEVKER